MFHQSDSSSHKLYDLPAGSSPDQSSCSSDTGDVLIRSTRVLLSDRRHEAGPGPGSIRITVQKLRDPPAQPPVAEQQQQSSGTEKQQRPKPRQKPDSAAPLRAAAYSQPDTRTLKKKPEPTKENRQPPAESSPDRKFSTGTHSHQQPGHDLLTSCFAAGGRGVVLTALKQRSHSAPHRREVRVQVLDPGPPQTSSQHAPGLSSQDASGLSSQHAPGVSSQHAPGLSSQHAPGLSSQHAPGVSSQHAPGLSSPHAVGVVGVQTEAGLSTGCPRDDTNSTTALMKVDARVSQLTDGVNKLLQADRDRGWSLSQQMLHHLETLHSQQLQLQSQLLESALRIVTGHAPVTSVTSDPTVTPDLTAAGGPARLQVTHLDSAANSNQQPRSSATTAAETRPVAMATPHRDRWPEQTR